MHEISLIRSVFETLESEFPGRLPDMRDIQIKVGVLSSMQPLLLQSAFEAVQEEEPRYRHLQLDVEQVPIRIHCPDCGQTSEVINYSFVCPCGRPCNNIISGDELLISQVSFAEPAAGQTLIESQ